MTTPINWTSAQYNDFSIKPQITEHGYDKLPMFDKSALIELLDHYPRKNLQAHTMGVDTTRYNEWQQVDIDSHSTGKDMWNAVENGRLWLNLVHIEKHRNEYKDLIAGMYAHLDTHCEHLINPRSTFSALLISSPGAQVYYHLDAEPNMLWHLKGEKNIWIYPAMDPEFTPQEFLEDIYAGDIIEDLPYSPEFDQHAMHHVMQPGEVASWPHNAPHRILNKGLNVSLATSYTTPDIYRREHVQLANRFILRELGISNRSMNERGPIAATKRISYRLINKIRPFKRNRRAASFTTDLILDPDSPTGFRKLSAPRLPAFANVN